MLQSSEIHSSTIQNEFRKFYFSSAHRAGELIIREEKKHDIDYINILKYLLTNLHNSFMYIHLSHSFTLNYNMSRCGGPSIHNQIHIR